MISFIIYLINWIYNYLDHAFFHYFNCNSIISLLRSLPPPMAESFSMLSTIFSSTILFNFKTIRFFSICQFWAFVIWPIYLFGGKIIRLNILCLTLATLVTGSTSVQWYYPRVIFSFIRILTFLLKRLQRMVKLMEIL